MVILFTSKFLFCLQCYNNAFSHPPSTKDVVWLDTAWVFTASATTVSARVRCLWQLTLHYPCQIGQWLFAYYEYIFLFHSSRFNSVTISRWEVFSKWSTHFVVNSWNDYCVIFPRCWYIWRLFTAVKFRFVLRLFLISFISDILSFFYKGNEVFM